MALADWTVCLRSDSPTQNPTYAIFLRKEILVEFRIAVVIDGCEHQAYAPLPTAEPG
jgi:hypothetical protein